MDSERFKEWLLETKNLSAKGCGDVVSRLNRCRRLVALENYDSMANYRDAVLQNPKFDNIPESSKNGMFRSVKLYFEFTERRP